MKIAVCIKQVPDTETRVQIDSEKNWIKESNVTFVLNPYDEFAVEEALKIKEKNGGEVILVCLGPERSISAIRTGLAMGADRAIHIKENRILNGLSVAKALAEILKGMNCDLILLGKQAVDDDNMQVGPMLAELMNLPSITVVTKLEIADSKVLAEREIEGGLEIVEAELPAVITAQKGLNEPRYPSLRGIMMAKKKPVEEVELQIPDSEIEILNMEYPEPRPEGKIVGEGPDAVKELVRLLKEEAKII
ncbi:electron transfer flavoprotein beta subunit/FixA family protein [candidate division KSB1 bacterium]|nr:MAG: electron transfer flavoprotein beta subunit/FixA family protein [candidate division KSB1 bacterium]